MCKKICKYGWNYQIIWLHHEHICHLRQVLVMLKKDSLYPNLKKCDFCMNRIIFLGYVVSAKDIEMDEAEIKGIQE